MASARPAHPRGAEIREAIGALERLVDVLGEETLRASSMRVLLRAQKGISLQAARLAGLACGVSAQAGFQVRAKVFADLVAATRDVHGVVGDGVYAASYSTVALDALTRSRGTDVTSTRRLREVLDDLDSRLHDTLTDAVRRGRYFVRQEDVMVRRVGGIFAPRASFEPVSSRFNVVLATLAPVRRPQPDVAEAVARRAAFGDSLSRSSLEVINGAYSERRARARLERLHPMSARDRN